MYVPCRERHRRSTSYRRDRLRGKPVNYPLVQVETPDNKVTHGDVELNVSKSGSVKPGPRRESLVSAILARSQTTTQSVNDGQKNNNREDSRSTNDFDSLLEVLRLVEVRITGNGNTGNLSCTWAVSRGREQNEQGYLSPAPVGHSQLENLGVSDGLITHVRVRRHKLIGGIGGHVREEPVEGTDTVAKF